MLELTRLDYDSNSHRFQIETNPFQVEVVRGIPNRRKLAGNNRWSATVNVANLRYLNKNKSKFIITQAAQAILDSYEEPERKQHELPDYEFKTRPMAHQREAIKRSFKQNHFALILPTGTGKTKIAIDLASLHWVANEINAALIVAPSSLLRNWLDEFNTHCPVLYDFHIYSSDTDYNRWLSRVDKNSLRVMAVSVEGIGISITPATTIEHFINFHRVHVIVDESTKIKNPDALRTKRLTEVARKAKFRTIASGTPITKSPEDLFAQYEFLNDGIFGVNNFISFKHRYCIMGGYQNRSIIGYRNMDEMLEIITDCSYVVDKKDALPDLPDKMYLTRYVKMTPEQKKLYREISKKALISTADGEVVIKNILTRMLRQSTVANGFLTSVDPDGNKITSPIVDKNPKITELMDTIDSVDGPIIIWAVAVWEILKIYEEVSKVYGKESIGLIYGQIGLEERQQTVRDFQAGKLRFIIGNQATGGLGLTMTAAWTAIYFSNTFNYIDRIQSEDRIHRKGQTRAVTIIDLIVEGTVDEDIKMSMEAKQDVAEYIRSNMHRLIEKGE